MVKTHIDKSYEAELTALREQLLVMGGLVEAAIADSVRAIIERDAALAEQVIRKDRAVNRMEVDIDGACRRILALRQPAASDLRFITTALKIVTDLERMGDLAVNIARRAVDLAQAPALRPLHDLGRLAALSEAALAKALDAFVTADPVKAEEVLEADDHLDALYLKVFNELLTTMMEDPRTIRRATSLMFSGKHLERFGDHATNLAEMVIFMVSGTDVRHAKNKA
jgi:phosphate transport system protein